jgi:hypothetical protein
MKTELICSITVTLNLYHEDKPEIKKTIRKFIFDDENDKNSEIEKFVRKSLKISEIEKYSIYGGYPKRKYPTMVIENEYGQRELTSFNIKYVIENEWSE